MDITEEVFLLYLLNKELIKSKAISAMEHQTDMQLDQIKQQMSLLAEQANKIKKS